MNVCDCERVCWQMCKHLGCGHWQTMSVTVCACTHVQDPVGKKKTTSGWPHHIDSGVLHHN